MDDGNNDTYIAIIGVVLMALIVIVFLSILTVFISRLFGEPAGMLLIGLVILAIVLAIAYYIYKYYTQKQAQSI